MLGADPVWYPKSRLTSSMGQRYFDRRKETKNDSATRPEPPPGAQNYTPPTYHRALRNLASGLPQLHTLGITAMQQVRTERGKLVQKHRYVPPFWMGTAQYEGGNGSVFVVNARDPFVRKELESARAALKCKIVGDRLPEGEVVIKVSFQPMDAPPPESDPLWPPMNIREASIHHALATSVCLPVPGCADPLCAKEYVPHLYFAGGWSNPADTLSKMYYVIVMSRAPGTTLRDKVMVLHQATKSKLVLTAEQYVRIERAVCALWANGVVHADLHSQNILLAGTKITLIDFGMSIMAPYATFRDKIMQSIAQGISGDVQCLGEIFKPQYVIGIPGLQDTVNRVIWNRKYRHYYYDDSSAMLYAYHALVKDKHKIPEARKTLWGFVAPRPQAPPPLKASNRLGQLLSQLPGGLTGTNRRLPNRRLPNRRPPNRRPPNHRPPNRRAPNHRPPNRPPTHHPFPLPYRTQPVPNRPFMGLVPFNPPRRHHPNTNISQRKRSAQNNAENARPSKYARTNKPNKPNKPNTAVIDWTKLFIPPPGPKPQKPKSPPRRPQKQPKKKSPEVIDLTGNSN